MCLSHDVHLTVFVIFALTTFFSLRYSSPFWSLSCDRGLNILNILSPCETNSNKTVITSTSVYDHK